MKVVHVISGLRGGGAEQVVLDLCKRSKNSGIDTEVVSLSHINDVAWKFGGITLFPEDITYTSKRNLPVFFTAWRAMLHLYRRNPQVIHAHMFYGCLAACLVKIFRPHIRIVFTLHNSIEKSLLRKSLLYFSKPLRNVDVVFTRKNLPWYIRKDAVEIPNGIDHSLYKKRVGDPPEIFTCLFVGRLEKQKQPLLLVEVAVKLKDRFPFVIVVAGEGSLKKEMLAAVRERGVENLFNFLGYNDDIPGLMNAAHCLLLPSEYEGMPLVVLEAAAAGLPVVCTPESVLAFGLEKEEVFISSTEKFDESILRIHGDYASALEKSRRMQQRLCSYTVDRMFAEYLRKWEGET